MKHEFRRLRDRFESITILTLVSYLLLKLTDCSIAFGIVIHSNNGSLILFGGSLNLFHSYLVKHYLISLFFFIV